MRRDYQSRWATQFGLESALETWTAGSLFVLLALLKVWNVFHYRFDSDEPQHLHVVWAWTRGLVQYRDIFDNHMPLFQLICAPLLALMGEHARDLYLMRLLMLPLYFLCLFFVFRIGRRVFSPRAGTWSAIGLACTGPFFFCTTEFRTDDLWTLFWLMAVFVLTAGGLRWRQALVAGLLLGLAFAVSMKSALMLFAIICAGVTSTVMVTGSRRVWKKRSLAKTAAVFLIAPAVPPLAVIAYFAANGVWPHMRYCVFEHNLASPVSRSNFYGHLLYFVLGMPLLIWLAHKLSRTCRSSLG